MSVRAGILVTGTEVITARITDRNGPWVSEQLAAHGIEVAHILVVADRPEDLEAGLRFMAAEGCDLIVTSGGLGPTADDLTAEIVARFAGVELELDTEMEAKIAAIIAGFARRMRFSDAALEAANRKQAMVPRGAVALDPAGTAPGLVLGVEDGPVVMVLPGPPRELHAMWDGALATAEVQAVLAGPSPTRSRRCGCSAFPSRRSPSRCARSAPRPTSRRSRSRPACAAASSRSTCATAPAPIGIARRWSPGWSRATSASSSASTARRSTSRSPICFATAARSRSASRARPACSRRGSRTRPGASAYLLGGVVTYSNQAKVDLLGVPPELIERHGAVSPEVAEAMADGALERFGADLGVGITGIAGPDGGHRGKASRLRVHLRPGARRVEARPRPGDPGRPQRDPRPILHARPAPGPAPAARRGLPALRPRRREWR